MSEQDDNETWLIETGHDVIEKKANVGPGSLRPWERLVYCLSNLKTDVAVQAASVPSSHCLNAAASTGMPNE